MEKLHTLLLHHNLSISIVESCTGGMLGSYLSNIPGSSKYFMGGIIAYNAIVKNRILNIPSHIEYVSEKCVVSMNKGLKKLIKSDIQVSVSGYLGPKASNPELLGIVFYSISFLENDHVFKLKIGNMERPTSKEFIVSNILYNLYEIINI
tara:strand:+ start:5455 stop:5904 length:450 start_codon:yes stop_codon:yes gene_type:complete